MYPGSRNNVNQQYNNRLGINCNGTANTYMDAIGMWCQGRHKETSFWQPILAINTVVDTSHFTLTVCTLTPLDSWLILIHVYTQGSCYYFAHPSIRSVVTKKGIEKRHPSIHSIGCYKKRNRKKKNSPSTFVFIVLLLLVTGTQLSIQSTMRYEMPLTLTHQCTTHSLFPILCGGKKNLNEQLAPRHPTGSPSFSSLFVARVALPPPHNPSFAQPHRRSTLRPPQYSSSARLLNELQR